MTMTKIPLRKAWYAHRHGPLILLFQSILHSENMTYVFEIIFRGIA